jgi:ketosteroid isomerase-like protein
MNAAEKLAREVLDALSNGDIERAGSLVAEDFTDHGAPP